MIASAGKIIRESLLMLYGSVTQDIVQF